MAKEGPEHAPECAAPEQDPGRARLDQTDRTGLRAGVTSTSTDGGRHGPIRTCVGCRRTDSWSALLRVVVDPSAQDLPGGMVRLLPDPRRRRGGRGAWLHPTVDCLELAVRRRAFGRALRVAGATDVGELTAHLETHSRNVSPARDL